MSEKNLTLDIDQMKLKGADFTETLKRLNPNYKQKTEDQMKEEQSLNDRILANLAKVANSDCEANIPVKVNLVAVDER